MENVTEMRKKLANLYTEIEDGKTSTGKAKNMIKLCDTMIKSATAEIRHAEHNGEVKEIPFLK